MNKNSEAVKI